MRVDDFDYDLPDGAIAQAPIEPRDASRLLIAQTLEEIPFRAFPTLLHEGDLIVVNETRVRSARLGTVRADTGGAVEVLLAQRLDDGTWEALLRPARRMRAGQVLEVGERRIVVLTDPVEGVSRVEITPDAGLDAFIEAHGTVPLPPYFHGTLDDPSRYQTMFAAAYGSSAAPTAALHFTPAVVDELAAAGVGVASVTLEVGLDTFRPMTGTHVRDHDMHSERIIVDETAAESVNRTRRSGGRIVAIGTTVVRTIESASDASGILRACDTRTELFITPGYRFRIVDALLTNFHAPRTTLIVMVASMLGDRWQTVYDHAVAEGFRFLSFGDAMFVEVER